MPRAVRPGARPCSTTHRKIHTSQLPQHPSSTTIGDMDDANKTSTIPKRRLRSIYRFIRSRFLRPLPITILLFISGAVCILLFKPTRLPPSENQPSTRSASTARPSTARTPVEIPPGASVEEAWSVIGTAIAEDDKLTFRAHSTPDVYDLVVRPRDLNGSQGVVVISHWDHITGRTGEIYNYPEELPASPGPGTCASETRPFSWMQADYTCDFTMDGKTTVARFALEKRDATWIVVDFEGLYG